VRHVRMLGLCLIAALAVCAYAVSSASALPEWGKCEAKAGGNYSDANCTVKAKPKGSGSYEWRKGSELPNVPFTSHNVGGGGVLSTNIFDCKEGKEEGELISGRWTRQACEGKGGGMRFSATGQVQVECESNSATGEQHGKKEVVNVNVVFTGCKAFGSFPCKSEGAAEEEIRTNTLKGDLGYINKAEKRVGTLLTPAKSKGTFAEFSCLEGVLVTTVGVGNKKEGAFYLTSGCYGECPGATPEEEKHGGYDGIIAPITPVNTMTNAYTVTYSVNPVTYENEPSKFEGKHIDLLEDWIDNTYEELEGGWSPAGEEVTDENIGAEAGEIKA
jgi:hypothetical protein